MKTIAQVLTDSLKGKWVAGHLFGDTDPCFSGIVEDIKLLQDYAGDNYLRFVLNTGQQNENADIYNIEALKLTVC